MPEWLRIALDEPKIRPAQYEPLWEHPEIPALRVALAVVAGFLAAGVFAVTFGRRRKDARSLCITLVLLSVLVAVLTQVIGDNMARAFGLVGALSIVRFRTVVEDTADTAFVIFAVTLGMAVGAGYALLAGLCIPAVALVAVLMNNYDRQRGNGNGLAALTVRFGLGFDPEPLLRPHFDTHLASHRLTATGTAKQGAAVELTYAAKLKNPAAALALIADLNKVEGVQGVEWKT